MAPDAVPPLRPQSPGLGRNGRLIVTAAAALGWLLLSVMVVSLYGEYRRTQARTQVAGQAAAAAGAASSALNQRLALVRGLAAFVAVKAAENEAGEIEREFEPLAAAFHHQVPGIRNISVAPDFVVRHVYPSDPGNLRVLGMHLLEDRRPGFADTVRRAVAERRLVVHEPVEMIQGGLGLLARQAIFVGDRPWGGVGMIFTLPVLVDEAAAALPPDVVWGLRTAAGTLVGGEAGVFARDPVLVTIELPDGHWDLATAPAAGWDAAAAQGVEPRALRLFLLLIGIALTMLCWTMLARRSELEGLAASRTRALKAANSELERFSFVVAHDLQEPLRSIISFSQLVERGLSQGLSEEQRTWLSGLAESARRMRALLHDVQVYLGENDAPLPRKTIPADEALTIALRKLDDRIRESGAMVETEILPVVWADHHRLSEILLALIGNAIEYRSPDRPPHITISARIAGEWATIHVADNGIGIEDGYFDRIFEVFQRLHPRSAHPGTGMGLAIAKKMAEHLGGTIRVASVPGQGSIFSVLLPSEGAGRPADRWERS